LKKRRSKSLGQFLSKAREKFRIHAPKNDFQSITEEPKYQAKALTVVSDTITGAAVVVTIPSIEQFFHRLLRFQLCRKIQNQSNHSSQSRSISTSSNNK